MIPFRNHSIHHRITILFFLYGFIVTQPAAFKMDYSPGSPEFWRDAVIAVKKRGTNYEMCNMRNFY